MHKQSAHAALIESAVPFLEALSSSRPVPAGGAAVAVSLAFSAGLGAKAARISDLEASMDAFLDLQRDALTAAVEDCEAFDSVLAARSAHGDGRSLGLAWRRATESPLSVVEIARRVIRHLDVLQPHARPSLACDVAAARGMALAAASASLANARENVRRVPPDLGRGELSPHLESLEMALAAASANKDEHP